MGFVNVLGVGEFDFPSFYFFRVLFSSWGAIIHALMAQIHALKPQCYRVSALADGYSCRCLCCWKMVIAQL